MVAIGDRWPSSEPDHIQLYSINSPNGIKVACMLEETGLAYEPHLVNLWEDEQHTDAFRSISPNSKIPVLTDPNGPDGQSVTMMESGAILLYLAEKTALFLPDNPVDRNECLQWLFFQIAHIGPFFGQFEHFHRRGEDNERDSYALERYRAESTRLLDVLETRLGGRENIMGDHYTIADMAIFPWVRSMQRIKHDGLPIDDFPNVVRWHTACLERPASIKGIEVNAVPKPAI